MDTYLHTIFACFSGVLHVAGLKVEIKWSSLLESRKQSQVC